MAEFHIRLTEEIDGAIGLRLVRTLKNVGFRDEKAPIEVKWNRIAPRQDLAFGVIRIQEHVELFGNNDGRNLGGKLLHADPGVPQESGASKVAAEVEC